MTQNIPEGSPRGRPLKFESVVVLEPRVNVYFDERLLSCARGPNAVAAADKLFFGVHWARVSDHTWVAIVNEFNDVITRIKICTCPTSSRSR